MMSSLKKWMALLGATALLFLVCHCLLPRLAAAPGMDVIRSNIRSDIDATAYFYTEIDDFLQFERAVRDCPFAGGEPSQPASSAP